MKVRTFYVHFGVELPVLPEIRNKDKYEVSYFDLPNREDIRKAISISDLDLQAIILFMASSGTAKAEALSLTVKDFINACRDYYSYDSEDLSFILDSLSKRDDVVPTFYIKCIKTDKFYYTFCTPEAYSVIVNYLSLRPNLSLEDKLFDFTHSRLLSSFQNINDSLGWGFKCKYRFFRTHTLRKFHASNIGLFAEYVDALQGRSKNSIHDTYIKTKPDRLKEMYISVMDNVIINRKNFENVNQEFNITINVFLSGKEYNIM
ncbi:integrase [uncultured Methanobrevibacter sp.]|uniref:integrase n=1 Tax=uncultured Methanobrevibacter sp. TaxID=253161 RepID=UPI0025EFF4F3|nr:integrase [uncultured Methanobrevibacter sp.]